MKYLPKILLAGAALLAAATLRAQSLDDFRARLAVPEPAAWGRGATVTVTEHGDAAARLAQASEGEVRLRFKGYRVCIFFDNGPEARAGAEAARRLCAENYPSVPVYISYSAPYFTVTAGDCVTAEEAIVLMGRIRATFPKAFPRSEELSVADLVLKESAEPTF